MTASAPRDPIGILRDFQSRAKRFAPGLPRVEEVRRIWMGIGFRVSGERLTFAVGEMRELLNFPRLTRVPGTKSWVKGVANVHGRLLTIVDLSGVLQGKVTEIRPCSRVLALRDEALPVGFLVDEVLGIRHFLEEDHSGDLAGFSAWLIPYIDGAYQWGEYRWGVLNLQSILQNPDFLNVAA